ncbi:tenascin isoform X2 [Cheilinus undulatus]|uniref:tenascin isoform X1 n=1 Tax=Cheilinus undulatus TaxID=241271 RepID=UPI001BD6AB11|nr:tenascin isoform X1 [Cheilinus undulatus]XP_041664189.1 tenascin isoform X2 [Cheilinus undulatus]
MSPSLLLVLLLAAPAVMIPSTSRELEVRGQRTPRDTKQDSIKVLVSEGCATQGDSSNIQGGKEIDLTPDSPLVLTHKIKLVPSGSGSGSCGCEADFAALRERLERLEREVSSLREKCGGAEGGCCTSKESKGPGCTIKPGDGDCPNECSDQGRCENGKCVCFPGFSGLDCSQSNCPGNCNNKGRCVNGHCVCDPGFTGPDCSQGGCPDNCNNRGRCVKGQCVCNPGFAPPDCSKRACPGNCNNRGRCVNGKCVCESGYSGADCSQSACPGNCNNRGRCVDGECVCDEGYGSADCSEIICPNDCFDRGRCVNGQCFCDEGFTGEDCSETTCPGNCNNRGRCVKGRCVCDEGSTGEDCSEDSCPGNCNNRGRCVKGRCVCDEGSTGEDCSEDSCPGNCNNRGRCVNGRCVCDEGSTGEDCLEDSCPGNCNNRGRCVNGRCVCDEGSTSEDCSEDSCPGNCNNRGRCVNGRCVCDEGSTGEDCSEDSCPGNCNNRGRCVNGQCVCDNGFTGEDCSEKACPNNCSNRGKCVNGKCVCNVGFAGPDCSAKGCPNNCSNKGRCVKGKCVCRRGFTGPDCSQCEEGKTGPNCDRVMSAVPQLSTRDVTESSVTLLWTPPPIQYETYHITFTSQKESDQQISVQVDGGLNTYTQTGLAAGQEYTVSITGEMDGRRGAESTAEFMTLISGPSNLHVVKTTSTSAVVQWEESQGEIDRYRLTITPNDGVGSSKELTFPPGQDSAHIQELVAGRLYDVTLVAEKGRSQSGPAFTQVTPGQTFPRETTATLTSQVRKAPKQDVGGRDRQFNQPKEKGSVKVGGIAGSHRDSVIARTKPPPGRKMPVNSTRSKLSERPTLSKKPKVAGPLRFNTTRAVPGGRKAGPGPLKKAPPTTAKSTKAAKPGIGDRDSALNGTDPRAEASNTDKADPRDPALISGTDPDTETQSGSQEPALTAGHGEKPDVGREDRGNETASVSSEPTGTGQSQEKKCMNKIKVTHIRFPIKDRGSGCKGGGQTPGFSEVDATPDLDYSPDPLHKLLTDTLDGLNITTFSVHLSKASDLSVDAEAVRERIIGGLQPLSAFRSSSSPHSSSPSPPLASSAEPSSLMDLNPRPSPSSPTPSPSSSSSSSEKSESSESNEPDFDNSKRPISAASSEDRRQPTTGNAGLPFYRRTPTKPGYGHRQFQNNTRLNVRVPPLPPQRLNPVPRGDSETPDSAPSGGLLSTPAPPASVERDAPTDGDRDALTTQLPSGAGQDERRRIPLRRVPPKRGYPHHSFAPPYNRTRPNTRLLPPRVPPVDPAPDRRQGPPSSAETPATSSPVSKDSHPAEGTEPREDNRDRAKMLTVKFNQTHRGRGRDGWSSHRPVKVGQRLTYGGYFQNKTQQSRQPHYPYRGPWRKPIPIREQDRSSDVPAESHTNLLEEDSTHKTSEKQLEGQDSQTPVQEVQTAEQQTAGEVPNTNTNEPDTTERPETDQSEADDPIQAAKPSEEEPIQGEDSDRAGTKMFTTNEFNQTHRGRGRAGFSSQRPMKVGQLHRPMYRGFPGNVSQTHPRQPHYPYRGPWRKPVPPRELDSSHEISDHQPDGQENPVPTQATGEPHTTAVIPSADTNEHDTTDGPETDKSEGRASDPIQTAKTREEEPIGEESKDRTGTEVSTTSTTNKPFSRRPTKAGHFRRPMFGGRFPNKTQTSLRPSLRPSLHPYRGPLPRPVPDGGSSIRSGVQTNLLDEESSHEIPDNLPAGWAVTSSPQGVQNTLTGGEDTTEVNPRTHSQEPGTPDKPEPHKLEEGPTTSVQTAKPGGGEASLQDLNPSTHKERVDPGRPSQGRPTVKRPGSTDLGHRGQRPVPKRPPARHPTQNQGLKHHLSQGERRENMKTNHTTRRGLASKPEQTGSKTPAGSNVPPTGVTREPLDHVGVTNRTSDGFQLVWDSPEGKYRNFVLTRNRVKDARAKKDQEEDQTKAGSKSGPREDENKVPESVGTTTKPSTGSEQTFKQVLPGSARSFQFENLPPQTEYTVTLLGKGPGILSRLHKLVISTGPEPPTDIVFSELTDNSLTVSWTKPKTAVSGFKVTYTHTEEGEPVSVSVDSNDSSLGLSKLSPGSTYEVSIISVLGLDESDPLQDSVMTLPDPPTDLRAVNITDTNALLLWRPALAAVDTYAIVYGSGTDSEVRISVSGNAAEQQLSGLEASTTYTVTITSQLGSKESAPATTTFTTTARGSGGDGDGPRDLQASNVTPRTALLSWKPPSNPVGSYRLTYQNEDQEMKELIVDGSVSQYDLSRLHPGSKYTVQLQAEQGGRYSTTISTEFTTGTLRFPFPTDCTQELLNGITTSGEVEIFPTGKLGPSLMVYCDMETDGGGWMVFQRRKDGSVDFFRGWKDYAKGFGDLSGEFWLGLENLHNLTTMTKMILRVDLRDQGESVFAKYTTFEVAKRNFKLSVGGYSGTAGDSLSYHNNRLFSTKDRDPMPFITRCAMSYRGGWWYKNCHEANLNGLYGIDVKHQGIIWTTWKGKEHSISFTEMKMRPAAFRG